jgi:hypothetical protein
LSNNETKTIQLKIVSPVAKKFIDTLVQKVTEEGWTYNYDKVFTNPFKVFLTKEVYIDSEEPDLTVVTGEYCKKGSFRLTSEELSEVSKKGYDLLTSNIQSKGVASLYDPETIALVVADAVTYDPEKVAVTIGGEVVTEFSVVEPTESILPVLEEPTSDSTEEPIAEPTPELIELVEAPIEPENKIGDGNVYTLEQLKDIQWHKLTKVGSAYGLHAMKRGDMEAAIVELSQGNAIC